MILSISKHWPAVVNLLATIWTHLSRKWFYYVMFAVALLHLFKLVQVDWYFIVLITIAGMPSWIGILSKYVRHFERTKEGAIKIAFAGTTASDDSAAPDLPAEDQRLEDQHEGRAPSLKKVSTNGPIKDLGKLPLLNLGHLSSEAVDVLKTLYEFQVATFGEALGVERWGFIVSHFSSDQRIFHEGMNELLALGFATIGGNGLLYITERGFDFCRRNRLELKLVPLRFKEFAPIPKGQSGWS